MNKPDLPIGIAGNGAIGNLLAWHCLQHQLPFCLLTRHSTPVEITLTTLEGHQHSLTPSVSLLRAPPPLAMLILPLKAYQIERALHDLPAQFDSQTPVVLLHNGMGTLEYVDALLPHNPVVVATTSMGAMKPATDQCRLTGQGASTAGWHRGEQSAHLVTDWLNALLPGLVWHPNIQQPLWDKLAVNAVINPLTAGYNIKNGELLLPKYAQEITALCAETAAVMDAMGLEAQADALVDRVRLVCRNTAQNQSSMLQDVTHRRPTELAYINGFLLENAARLGVPCPVHSAVVKRLLD